MGCATSTTTDDRASAEAVAVRKYLAMRAAMAPGYLTRDPTSLNDYRLLLKKEGAIDQDDDSDDDDDVLSAARGIKLLWSLPSDVASDTSSVRSALRSRPSDCASSDRTTQRSSAFFARGSSGTSCDFRRHVSFEGHRSCGESSPSSNAEVDDWDLSLSPRSQQLYHPCAVSSTL